MFQKRAGNVLIGVGIALLGVWAAARLHSTLGSRRDRAAFAALAAARAARAAETPAPPPVPTPVPIPEAGPVDVSLWSAIRIKEWK